MSSSKFTVESDFVDSFLQSTLISTYYRGNVNIDSDAKVLSLCLNLDEDTLKTANCSARKERVQGFITQLGDEYLRKKEVAISNCAEQVLNSHKIYYAKMKADKNPYVNGLNEIMLNQNLMKLKNCIDSNL